MNKSRVSVVERQGRRYGYAVGGKRIATSPIAAAPRNDSVSFGSAMNGMPSRHALRGEIVEPWEDVEWMCSMNQERRRMREALDLNRAQMLAAQEAQRVLDRKARRKVRLLEGIRTAVTVLLFLIAFYGLLCCMVTQAAGYGLGAAASLLIGGRVCG